MLDEERRKLALSIAQEVLSRGEAEREETLIRACSDDPSLRSLVESLMVALLSDPGASDPSANEPYQESRVGNDAQGNTAVQVTRDRPPSAEETDSTLEFDYEPDEMIGEYRIVQRLGEGGFGVVYHAIQEKPFRRDVAIKVLKPGMDSKQVIARFGAERQALALMNHAGIAKVFDAGTTYVGRPYFVMELVRGIAVTKFCDEQRLSIKQRIELFIEICRAIQHAHHKGVIHRDIKPSNILVAPGDNRPKPVIIDFGVAKATSQRLADGTIATQFDQIIGTPMYMSPEQANLGGMDVDTRTDIYSLGAVLYELIAGRRPFSKDEISKIPPYDFGRFLAEAQLAPPSSHFAVSNEKSLKYAARRRADVDSIYRALRGDLDRIVSMAMDPDRSRRYETASGFALDLQRYLNNEPVRAHRPSTLYSLSKFSRRHRGKVVAGSIALASLAIGLVMSLYMYFMASERAQQLQRLSDANEVELLEREFPTLLAVPIPERRDAIDRWLRRIRLAASHLPSHRTALKNLSIDAEPPDDSEAGFYHQKLEKLVAALARMNERGGEIDQVARWQSLLPSPQEIDDAWTRFRLDVSPRHPQWNITQLDWLYPLGKNPQTDLWEFADLQFGLGPIRDESGEHHMTADSGIVYVLIPGGTFSMGSPANEPQRKDDETLHAVTVSPFLISKFEVTRAQWKRVGRSLRVPRSRNQGPTYPVVGVSWFDCQTYCLETHSRLPTEAEWEYACRAGTTGPFSGTGDPRDMAWFSAISGGEIHPVGTQQANQFGLFNMHGNASEWCADRYAEDFYRQSEPSVPVVDPLNPVEHRYRVEGVSKACLAVLRGGHSAAPSRYCRSADRFRELQDIDTPTTGFRVCLGGVIRNLPTRFPSDSPEVAHD